MPQRPLAALRDELERALAGLRGDPRIVVFGCDHAVDVHRFARADTGAVSLLCAGQLPPSFVEYALRGGADGVLVAGCERDGCRYRLGDAWTAERLGGAPRAAPPRERAGGTSARPRGRRARRGSRASSTRSARRSAALQSAARRARPPAAPAAGRDDRRDGAPMRMTAALRPVLDLPGAPRLVARHRCLLRAPGAARRRAPAARGGVARARARSARRVGDLLAPPRRGAHAVSRAALPGRRLLPRRARRARGSLGAGVVRGLRRPRLDGERRAALRIARLGVARVRGGRHRADERRAVPRSRPAGDVELRPGARRSAVSRRAGGVRPRFRRRDAACARGAGAGRTRARRRRCATLRPQRRRGVGGDRARRLRAGRGSRYPTGSPASATTSSSSGAAATCCSSPGRC